MDVTEDLPLEPLTDYSKYKAMCEDVLERGARARLRHRHAAAGDGLRLCAAAAPRPDRQHPHQPRRQQRPHHGVRRRAAASQPPCRGHDRSLSAAARSAGRGDRRQDLERRLSQSQGARDRRHGAAPRSGRSVDIVVTPTDDHRSYHVSSEKIRRELGFTAKRTVEDAIVDLQDRVPRRQGAERDDRRPLLQHQAHAEREAAMMAGALVQAS